MFYSEAGVICAECSPANIRFKPLINFYAATARRGAMWRGAARPALDSRTA